jgi:hypothetical protein
VRGVKLRSCIRRDDLAKRSAIAPFSQASYRWREMVIAAHREYREGLSTRRTIVTLLAIGVGALAASAAAPSGTNETEAGSPAGTWHTSEISQADAEATLRRYGLGKWIQRFRRQTPFTEPIALLLVVRKADWDLYGKPKGKPKFAIDYDAKWWLPDGRTVRKIHGTGITTFRWSVSGGALTLRWLGTTEPDVMGIPDEVFQRALYMTQKFSRGPVK